MKQLLDSTEIAELFMLNCLTIAYHRLNSMGEVGGGKSMFLNRAKTLNEPYNQLGANTAKHCFSTAILMFL